jgi:hypothetical protein
MSNTKPPASSSSSSNLKVIFDATVTAYEKKTKKVLRTHPLMDQLNACDPQPPAPEQILLLLRAQVGTIEESTSGDDELISWVEPIVTVISMYSSTISTAVGLAVSPIRMILLRANL